MKDFLEENNVCGQQLLRIVSQGNAIIAELNRLQDVVPPVFHLENKQITNEYTEIIFDFKHFKSLDSINKKIENDVKLARKDEEFRETYGELLGKFYLVFESIHRYSVDLERFFSELDDGVFIQQTFDSILMDHDGRQLVCEAIYLMGVIMLTLDTNIEGVVRERILVSYYRYSTQRSDSNFDDVCNLVRSTGYSPNAKRPANYPENFFKRTQLRSSHVKAVIGRLRSDDVYNLVHAFSNFEYRSVAYATQASMLYVVLYFVPEVLHTESAIMREIVDKFFADNFIISVYMGTIVNLVEHWDVYKAAKAALSNTIDARNLRNLSLRYQKEIVDLNGHFFQLKESELNDVNILNNINEHIGWMRRANVTLRWVMLHTVPLPAHFTNVSSVAKRCKTIRENILVELKYDPPSLFKLLLNTSQFELQVREVFKGLLTNKHASLLKYKEETIKLIRELEQVFAGNKQLTRVAPNESMRKWFDEFAGKVDSLVLEPETSDKQYKSISRKVIQLVNILDEVQEFHQLQSDLQIKQHLADARNCLLLMIKTIDVKESVLVTQQIIADLSYAWQIIDVCFTSFMQEGIKKDPSLVAKLRATFLKLASALDLPLLRINQAGSSDLVKVSQFYSSELVLYVRKVLHIIPETMFMLMGQIIAIQTNSLKELPTRLMKDQLKSYAQLDDRFKIAKLTNDIAVFTEGVLAMKSTLVGVIQIDPKRLLEDGIKRELVTQVAQALHSTLIFKGKPNEVTVQLNKLNQLMSGLKRSFEYIQDYVRINGLKMWQEQVSRIVNYNVEQECNAFMRHKVLDHLSLFQSKSTPIPKFMPLDPYSLNFIGRLVREIVRITDPK